jgi:hypothetical protein
VFAYRAAQRLGDTAGWRERLESALDRMGGPGDGARGASWYARGLLEQALGRDAQAAASFRRALLAPDRMLSHYYTRLAMSAP